jgi:hypothetical protein
VREPSGALCAMPSGALCAMPSGALCATSPGAQDEFRRSCG